MECWEEWSCFLMVPIFVFLSLLVCGCCCGIGCGYICPSCLDSADDEEKAKKKSSTDSIRYILCKIAESIILEHIR